MGSLVDWTWLSKESLSVKIVNRNFQTKKATRKVMKITEQTIQELGDNDKRYNIHVMGNQNEKNERKETIFETMKNSPN